MRYKKRPANPFEKAKERETITQLIKERDQLKALVEKTENELSTTSIERSALRAAVSMLHKDIDKLKEVRLHQLNAIHGLKCKRIADKVERKSLLEAVKQMKKEVEQIEFEKGNLRTELFVAKRDLRSYVKECDRKQETIDNYGKLVEKLLKDGK